jgi:hypothetical protein
MKNAIFWDVLPCGSCKNQCSSKTSVLTRATWRNILEDGILHDILYLIKLVKIMKFNHSKWLGSLVQYVSICNN